MIRLLGIVLLAALAVALATSGVRGLVQRRVVTRAKQDLAGTPAMVAGVILIAAAFGVAWAVFELVKVWPR